VFSGWIDRAILTPAPVSSWGARERVLAGRFIVLPATTESLMSLIDVFGGAEPAEPENGASRSLVDLGPDAAPLELTERLRSDLGPGLFSWLCACAVYPELHWDLTLHLASLPCMPEGLVTEANLLRLLGLRWFRSGMIPDEMRSELIRQLNAEQERGVRKAIITVLENNPAEEGTFAFDAQALEIAVSRYAVSESKGERRAARESLRQLSVGDGFGDRVVLRSIESDQVSPLDLLLPPALRYVFFQRGSSLLGLRSAVRLAMTMAVVAIGYAGLTSWRIMQAGKSARSAGDEMVSSALAGLRPRATPASPAGAPVPNAAAQPSEPSAMASLRQLFTPQKGAAAPGETPPVTQPTATGPGSGVLQWSGSVPAGGAQVVIYDGTRLGGALSGNALPGVPVRVGVLDQPDIRITEAPGPGNGYRRLVLQVPANTNKPIRLNWQVAQTASAAANQSPDAGRDNPWLLREAANSIKSSLLAASATNPQADRFGALREAADALKSAYERIDTKNMAEVDVLLRSKRCQIGRIGSDLDRVLDAMRLWLETETRYWKTWSDVEQKRVDAQTKTLASMEQDQKRAAEMVENEKQAREELLRRKAGLETAKRTQETISQIDGIVKDILGSEAYQANAEKEFDELSTKIANMKADISARVVDMRQNMAKLDTFSSDMTAFYELNRAAAIEVCNTVQP
jgi:hypothetical protein